MTFSKPIEIEQGKTYVLESDTNLYPEQIEAIKLSWLKRVGKAPIILTGGIKIAQQNSEAIIRVKIAQELEEHIDSREKDLNDNWESIADPKAYNEISHELGIMRRCVKFIRKGGAE